ncbi:MAG TPA: pitrilysin family protein [Rhizomicrobium sp.]|nr:pitrilysin family protein [Rhizomicrobium sp.]
MTRWLPALVFALLVAAPASAVNVKRLDAVTGASVWFAEDHGVPMIALSASFPSGSSYDPSGKAGMAALAAAMMDEGAGGLSSDAFQAALAVKGIRLEAKCDRDYTVVTLVTLSSNAKEAFRLLALALNKPRFDPETVARVKIQMLQEIQAAREDPAAVAEKGFYSLYFGPYTYGRPVGGDPAGLSSISAQELRAFASNHWVRGGLKIAVAGDAGAAAIAALLKSTFAGLPETAPSLPPPPFRAGAPGVHTLPMDVPQPAVFFGLPGLQRSDKDFIAAMVANYILGGGDTSRLMTDVRERRGLTYDVSTELVPLRRAGLLLGTVATRRDAVRRTIALVRNTMTRFASEGPTDREVTDAKQYLNGSFPLSFTSDADIAAQLNVFQQEGLPLDYLARRADLINAVSSADVRRVARRLFDPARMTIVIAGTLPTVNTEPANTEPADTEPADTP